MATDLRATGRAVLVAVALVAGACSFKDKGINTNAVDTDADVGLIGSGGSAGNGTGGSGLAGSGGSTLDGSTMLADGPGPAPADASTLADLALDGPAQPLGKGCQADNACASGFCADGVCCDKRCGEPCFSCNGASPGSCKPDPVATPCGPASCKGSTFTPEPACDGNGACLPKAAMMCPNNFSCGSVTSCFTKCTANNECANGMVCDVAAGTCKPPGKANGQACAAGSECMSGNCADKVCCDLACTGVCRACVMAQTGKPDGTCANLLNGAKDTRCTPQDPSTCGRDGACDGAGHCRNWANGTRCATSCCNGSGPGGGEARVCAFECNNGTCDRNRPMVLDRCGGGQCCCPGAVGGPACTLGLTCAGGCAP